MQRSVVEQAEDLRGEALFALGYWAGCRVSDVAHLLKEGLQHVSLLFSPVSKKSSREFEQLLQRRNAFSPHVCLPLKAEDKRVGEKKRDQNQALSVP